MREVPGFPGYFADETGRVFSNRHKHGPLKEPRELRQTRMPHGYLMIRTCINGQVRFMGAHRAVALAFHGPPPVDRPVVRHLDGSRDNNVPSNLAWGTNSENAQDRFLHGTDSAGQKNANALLDDKTVREVFAQREDGHSHHAIDVVLGLSEGTAGRVLRSTAWKRVDVPDPLRVKNRAKPRVAQDHGRALLTNDQVREIRKRYSIGDITQRELAAEYRVAPSTISAIIRRINWRTLDQPHSSPSASERSTNDA